MSKLHKNNFRNRTIISYLELRSNG